MSNTYNFKNCLECGQEVKQGQPLYAMDMGVQHQNCPPVEPIIIAEAEDDVMSTIRGHLGLAKDIQGQTFGDTAKSSLLGGTWRVRTNRLDGGYEGQPKHIRIDLNQV